MKKYSKTAKAFCDALRELDAARIDNLELYLSRHFGEWLERYACTPEGLTYELQTFAAAAP